MGDRSAECLEFVRNLYTGTYANARTTETPSKFYHHFFNEPSDTPLFTLSEISSAFDAVVLQVEIPVAASSIPPPAVTSSSFQTPAPAAHSSTPAYQFAVSGSHLTTGYSRSEEASKHIEHLLTENADLRGEVDRLSYALQAATMREHRLHQQMAELQNSLADVQAKLISSESNLAQLVCQREEENKRFHVGASPSPAGIHHDRTRSLWITPS